MRRLVDKKRIWVLASGGPRKDDGGSGFREMVECTETTPAILNAEIVGVTSNHAAGGVYTKARDLGIPFEHWQGPFTAEGYQQRFSAHKADFCICSGWLFPVSGLDPACNANIHPGDLPRFGGKGMWGHHVHEAVMAAFHKGEVTQSAVTMHFVTDYEKEKVKGDADPYDKGMRIIRFPVRIRFEDTPETLAKRVNEVERVMQARVLNLIVNHQIWLDSDGVVRYDSAARTALHLMGGIFN